MDGSSNTPRGSADAWIDAAYRLLVEQGVDAVKVMTLAKATGLSRTGFYWHFTDRDALLAALLDRWRDKNTGNLVRRTEAYAETITEALFNLCDCWLMPDLFDARLDFAVRGWALADPAVAPALKAADEERLRAIGAMFRRFGYDSAEADIRARTIYLTQVGYISMMVEEPADQRLARVPAYTEVFAGRAPSEAVIARFNARHMAVSPR